MQPGHSCLLIVDVQVGFINEATQHLPALVQAAQAAYDHVVVARFFNPDNSFFRTLINWDRFSVGSEDVELAFKPRADALIIDKSTYSCVDDGFVDWLAQRRISTVHVCGIETDICVTKCAADLFERGIVPVVLGDLCASCSGEEAHRRALETLKKYIGDGQVREFRLLPRDWRQE